MTSNRRPLTTTWSPYAPLSIGPSIAPLHVPTMKGTQAIGTTRQQPAPHARPLKRGPPSAPCGQGSGPVLAWVVFSGHQRACAWGMQPWKHIFHFQPAHHTLPPQVLPIKHMTDAKHLNASDIGTVKKMVGTPLPLPASRPWAPPTTVTQIPTYPYEQSNSGLTVLASWVHTSPSRNGW